MARVWIVSPPGRSEHVLRACPPPPLALASLGASLRAGGHEPVLLDLVRTPLDDEALATLVRERPPDALGLSVIGSATPGARRVARIVRDALPDCFVFAGNALPSEHADWFFEQVPEADAVVVGEGERTLVRLLDASAGSPVAGVRRRGDAADGFEVAPQIDDLDDLPHPAWDLLDARGYRASPQFLLRSQPILAVLQSRGCPWDCSFCAQNFPWERVRERSMESLADEVERNYVDHGVDHFGFYDSIFPLRKQHGEDLYRALEARGLLGKVRFGCETRVDMVWPETFRWLRRAGLHVVFLGIESPSPELLRAQEKTRSGYDVGATLRTLNALGIRSYGLFILGLAGESSADRARLDAFVRSLPIDVISISLHAVHAGSPEARAAREAAGGAGAPPSADGTDETLEQARRDIMRSFYLRPRQIARLVRRGDMKWSEMMRGAASVLRAG